MFKMKKAKLNLALLFLVLFLVLSSMSFIQANCCFDPSSGLCSENSEENSCVSENAEFYDSQCSVVDKCSKGCCYLGSSTKFVTLRTCELLTRSYGFEERFETISEAQCTLSEEAKEFGACILGGSYEQRCKYSIREECPTGNFYSGVLCTSPELNTICKKTENTICYSDNGEKEDVHYLDSCGNPDALVEDCDYNSGTVCGKVGRDYNCKNINCNNGKKNGDSWCVSEDPNKVGSRYFKQYCLNGEISTEPCADFRMETCDTGSSESSGGEAKCEINPWQDCLNAGNESEDCNEDYCNFIKIGSEDKNSLIPTLGISGCVPKFAGGLPFWPTKGSAKLTTDSAKSVCSMGNFNSQVEFFQYRYKVDLTAVWIDFGNYGAEREWGLKITDFVNYMTDSWGNAGILAAEKNQWSSIGAKTEREGKEGNIYCDDYEKQSINCEYGVYLLWLINPWAYPDLMDFCDLLKSVGRCSMIDEIRAGTRTTIPVNPKLIEELDAKCASIGDCAGIVNMKASWLDEKGQEVFSGNVVVNEGKYEIPCIVNTAEKVTCALNYECKPFKAPKDGDCKKCGSDNLPCSEYRCKSIGKNCDYVEREGIGRCVSESDNSAPKISCSEGGCPSEPITPYANVQLSIKTDEESECKFSINGAGAKFSEMKYDFGDNFGFEHSIILSLPGKMAGLNESDIKNYPIITRDGKYSVYVRCLDAAGNGEASSPFTINFEVMQTPDGNSPIILSANPASGTRIVYNSTIKTAVFRINEPSQCKWDDYDKDFDSMQNTMACDESPSETGALLGYFCRTTFTNITKEMGKQSNFYIRCKDQPWLEGKENDLYKRNKNSVSFGYILKPSSQLIITEISPSGDLIKRRNNTAIELIAKTTGGSNNGKAECKWKLTNENITGNVSFIRFLITNTSLSKQTLSYPALGKSFVEVKCEDEAGNYAESNTSFNILLDLIPPVINRLYWKTDSLKIKTNENAICYFSFDKLNGCSFELTESNVTAMTGNEKEHTTTWKDDKSYYIKCIDNQGNTSPCAIIRTY